VTYLGDFHPSTRLHRLAPRQECQHCNAPIWTHERDLCSRVRGSAGLCRLDP
jgi:hypothetical protein